RRFGGNVRQAAGARRGIVARARADPRGDGGEGDVPEFGLWSAAPALLAGRRVGGRAARRRGAAGAGSAGGGVSRAREAGEADPVRDASGGRGALGGDRRRGGAAGRADHAEAFGVGGAVHGRGGGGEGPD